MTIINKTKETQMTIFYSKFSGVIEAAFSGVVDFNVFVDREQELKSYCKKIIIPFNFELLNRSYCYKLDLETNTIVIRKEYIPISIPITVQ